MEETYKIIYVVNVSPNTIIDDIDDAYIFSPCVTTNLLKAFRSAQRLISEVKDEHSVIEYKQGIPTSLRKKNPHLDPFKAYPNGFHNVCIAVWNVTGMNEKTKKLMRKGSDNRHITIIAYKIKL